MGEAPKRELEELSGHQVITRLAGLSAWTHYDAPEQVKRRVYALMDVHAALDAPARTAYLEALDLLDELGQREQALEWVGSHGGFAGVWPHAERTAMVERLRPRA